ncbi:PLU-1-domain-containing protein [Sporormia fimetaria CBS 119925]|uniref:PLU-1-domain-containing protein n=1 Tax=Sporormia fimetaria CBS 119925 TaxID=1340428 RepID=A0A6A6V130_9PLEO|nr:PLU-1-domain-containing protein [Sporormia fimetaria CBS 119925]
MTTSNGISSSASLPPTTQSAATTATAAPKSRMGSGAPSVNGSQTNYPPAIPLSARVSAPLDLNTVERRRPGISDIDPPKRNRMFDLQEAPTYRPTEEDFRDPIQYIGRIREEAAQYGIAKIIPPATWNPKFAVDTERFHFKTRRQELNSIEGGTRANLNYLDQLAKFHKQHGHNLTRFPSVDKRPLDLYKLKKAVETRGGFERVCKGKKWAEIGRDLGYSGKIMSSLSTSLKNSYQKWLYPYEEYLRVVKPGVHQLLEMENGGPFTPSPAPSPLKNSTHGTPAANLLDSPAARASAALNASIHGEVSATPPPETVRPPHKPNGFTAVNAGGFTAVNTHPPPPPVVHSGPSSFTPVNAPGALHRDVIDSNASTPLRNGTSPMLSAHNTPDLRPTTFTSTSHPNGHSSQQLKRTLSPETEMGVSSETDPTGSNRRSKRAKKETAPTVAGSHMVQPRVSTPQPSNPTVRSADERPGDRCEACGQDYDPSNILLCDSCDAGYHGYCLDPPIDGVPEYDWHCPKCLVGTGEFGFEEGAVYSLKQFQEKANNFKEGHFANKRTFDPVTNSKRPVSEDDVEREFWRLVESLTETVEVEYGADVHSTTHGSGFPTIERSPRDPYSVDPWNLNILPYHPESLFRHIKTDISGMTVPWLYVGMVFATFCWHNEDHYTYSANYQHFGATKTWYGIPADDAEKFEQAMREAVPELFETQPDLLFQLVTLLTPEQLKKAGVRVFALDQRAGEFVITFPQAYHAGFNHGFNFNEAVNFAPHDWEPFGELGVQRLQDYRRQPCFSHDELLLSAAMRKDMSIKTAKWLAPALERMRDRELGVRADFLERHKAAGQHKCKIDGTGEGEQYACPLQLETDDTAGGEDELICTHCKCYAFLSRFVCARSDKIMCLRHAGTFECCSLPEPDRNLGSEGHRLVYHLSDAALTAFVQKVADKACAPEAWRAKFDSLLSEGPDPQLKALRSLLTEGEKIEWDLDGLDDLKEFVERCTELNDEALNYTTRKQQVRRKNERVGRGRGAAKAAASAQDADEKEKEYRKIENLQELIKKADHLAFDSPELVALRERFDDIADYQERVQAALRDSPSSQSVPRLDELLEEGRSFNVDIPEIESLDKVVQQLKWLKTAVDLKKKSTTLEEVSDLIQQGLDLGMPDNHPQIHFYREKKSQGELWESKAKELMSVENVHYQQLDALSKQASALPVNPETLAKVEAILKKQRDAQNLIISLYERSKNPDFRQRPKYKEVREAMEALSALNSKPAGTIDLEKQQKIHEDWMRRGKKLFGKANAPLHILHAHMKQVEERNTYCFDVTEQPQGPVEPASRDNSPEANGDYTGPGQNRPAYCICRRPEAGTMIECDVCLEWYHGKCFKLPRGKYREEDGYTCPICDWRVKIPRDAARPKLEDLQAWQDEIPNLPFQPDEEETLESIIDTGVRFREHVSRFINPVLSGPDELSSHRFFLRKLEGADILLVEELNFFKQEVHKLRSVADTPPPLISVSLSTRKPRPTKQQKQLMSQMASASSPGQMSSAAQMTPKTKGPGSKHRQSIDGSAVHGTDEASHTPPGEPPSSRQRFSEQDYFTSQPASAFDNSPTFAPDAASNGGTTSPMHAIDPNLFEPGGHAPTSVMHDVFKSSSSGGEIFPDVADNGGGHAEEALAVTESSGYAE